MVDGRLALNKGIFSDANTKERIVTDYQTIKKFVENCRGLGIRIVLTQGTFDMVHIGHGRYLANAKAHGDLLIVGVDSDEKVRHRKGPDRPVVPEHERLEMLTHIRPVDLVFLKQLNDPKWQLIKTIQPDILIATAETYNKKQLKELQKHCGKVVVLPRQATTTTSAKLRLMQMGVAQKLGQALTPKLIGVIQETLSEVKEQSGKKTEKKTTQQKNSSRKKK